MRRVDAGEALGDLTRLSAEIESAAIVDDSGAPLAVTAGADGEELARMAAEILDIAAAVDPAPAQRGLGESLRAGERVAVATTRPEPPAALVVHDLRTCLTGLGAVGRPATAKRKRKQDPVDA